MKQMSAEVARAIEHLKTESNDFATFIGWLEASYEEKISELLLMDRNNIQTGQGYSLALNDILKKVGSARETLDRSNKNRDTR